jgi:outer membrane protein assembly factor BamB
VALPSPPASGGVADAGRIFVPLQAGQLMALDRETGARLWSREIDSPWVPEPAGDSLLVTASDGLYEIDAATGATIQRIELPARPAGPMARAGGLMLVSLASGAVRAVRLDGSPAWEVALGASSSHAPAVAGSCEAVYLSLDDGRLVALACDGSGVRWSRSIGGVLTAPVLSGNRVFVGSTDDRLYAFDAGSGRLAWHWPTGNDVVGAAADADRVFLVSLDNLVLALDRGSGNLRWQQPMVTRPVGPPFLVGDRLYVPGVRPSLLAYEAATGVQMAALALPKDYALSVLAGPPLVLPDDPASRVQVAVVARDGTVIGLGPAP